MELISAVIKCFCATCLDRQCPSIKCTRCRKAVTMTGLTPFDASCLFEYINGQASRSTESGVRRFTWASNLGETIEYAPIRKAIHGGYTLTKWTRVNWMNCDVNWTSYIDLAEFHHHRVHMERVACW